MEEVEVEMGWRRWKGGGSGSKDGVEEVEGRK